MRSFGRTTRLAKGSNPSPVPGRLEKAPSWDTLSPGRGLCFRLRRYANGPRCLAVVLACFAVFAGGCRRPPPPKAYAAFVVNHQSSTLAEVDLAKFRVLATVAVAARPERVLVRPRGKELWVVSASGENSVVEFPGLRVVRRLRMAEGA